MSRAARALRIGLTGGIGSGKSTAARYLADLGATVIDADALARDVVEPGTPGLAQITEHFGADILHEDGTLNRKALGEIVFADPTARHALEEIVLPRIAQRAAELLDAVPAGKVGVYDMPLLVEQRAWKNFDAVIVVQAPHELRLERLEGRGVSREAALARMAQQASDEERRRVAHYVIYNDGSPQDLHRAVVRVWEQIAGHEPQQKSQKR